MGNTSIGVISCERCHMGATAVEAYRIYYCGTGKASEKGRGQATTQATMAGWVGEKLGHHERSILSRALSLIYAPEREEIRLNREGYTGQNADLGSCVALVTLYRQPRFCASVSSSIKMGSIKGPTYEEATECQMPRLVFATVCDVLMLRCYR